MLPNDFSTWLKFSFQAFSDELGRQLYVGSSFLWRASRCVHLRFPIHAWQKRRQFISLSKVHLFFCALPCLLCHLHVYKHRDKVYPCSQTTKLKGQYAFLSSYFYECENMQGVKIYSFMYAIILTIDELAWQC